MDCLVFKEPSEGVSTDAVVVGETTSSNPTATHGRLVACQALSTIIENIADDPAGKD